MRSLWLKVMGAFALVILIGVAANAVLVSRATSGRFSQYVTENGQLWAQNVAPALASYYARNGSWQGAEAVLRSPWPGMMGAGASGTEGGMGGMMGRGMGDMMGGDWWDSAQPPAGTDRDMMRGGDMMMDGDMWAAMGVRLLLADPRGVIVADTASALTGTALKLADLAAGTPVLVNDRQVGTVLAVSTLAGAATPADEFLSAASRSVWLSGLAAGGLALVLGLLLFRQIIAPVRAVTAAAERVAAGQLDQRVPVTSQDEIGQLAHTFNQMADALAHDRQLRQNMVADVAHELRTPLSVIQANLEAMLDGVLPASSEEIASLHEETTLLARLVADLRLLSLAEAGQLKLEPAPTDLGELVSRVVERMRFQAEAGGVALSVQVAPSLPSIQVDADRIGQVIGNLVSNAVRYTPPGGKVIVRVTAEAPSSLSVQIQDTGQGITPEDLPHVFDRFYRADKSRSRASGGSGIGLTIAKYLVEAHGGRIWATSPGPGRGSTFAFSLPVG